MPDEFFVRATAVHTRIQQVTQHARQAAADGDMNRLHALEAESRLLYDNMVQIRQEQLAAQLERDRPRPPWWRQLFSRSDPGGAHGDA